ncbi:MAG: hypothetical protein ACK4E8_04185 [Lacibacter sp.]|jgi:hypothetical protein
MTVISANAKAGKFIENSQRDVALNLGNCTVTVTVTQRGIDCWGNIFMIEVTENAKAGNCLEAYQQASAAAHSKVLQAVAAIQDECFGPTNP